MDSRVSVCIHKDFPNYIVYPDGRIYTKNYSRFLTPETVWTGYKRVCLTNKDGRRVRVYVHKLVAECFIPNTKNKPFVNHRNGIKSDNSKDNLEWVTQSENMCHSRDVLGNDFQDRLGEGNPYNKLSSEDVLSIYMELLAGTTTQILADKYQVSTGCIHKIKSRKCWSHLTRHLPDQKFRKKRVRYAWEDQ